MYVASDYMFRALQRLESCTKLAEQVVKEHSARSGDFEPVCFSTMFSELPACKKFNTTLNVEEINNLEIYFVKTRFAELINETHLFKLVFYLLPEW